MDSCGTTFKKKRRPFAFHPVMQIVGYIRDNGIQEVGVLVVLGVLHAGAWDCARVWTVAEGVSSGDARVKLSVKRDVAVKRG